MKKSEIYQRLRGCKTGADRIVQIKEYLRAGGTLTEMEMQIKCNIDRPRLLMRDCDWAERFTVTITDAGGVIHSNIAAWRAREGAA